MDELRYISGGMEEKMKDERMKVKRRERDGKCPLGGWKKPDIVLKKIKFIFLYITKLIISIFIFSRYYIPTHKLNKGIYRHGRL